MVPNEEKFMTDTLGITVYPTHILVGKNGKIIKVTNSIDDMIPFVQHESWKAGL